MHALSAVQQAAGQAAQQRARTAQLSAAAHLVSRVEQQHVADDNVVVLDQHLLAGAHDLDLDDVLLGIQLAELQVLLVVVQSGCASAWPCAARCAVGVGGSSRAGVLARGQCWERAGTQLLQACAGVHSCCRRARAAAGARELRHAVAWAHAPTVVTRKMATQMATPSIHLRSRRSSGMAAPSTVDSCAERSARVQQACMHACGA